MPFAGETIETTEVPWDYLLHYFGFKLPEVIVVLALAALGVLVASWLRRRPTRHQARERAIWTLVAAAILLPPTWAIVRHSPLYDGLRHFLFLLPPIAAAGATTAVGAIAWIRRRHLVLALVPAGALALAAADQVRTMAHLHPHEGVYFNRFVGGLPGAFGRYDTDYYGNSYREAFALLHEHLWRTRRGEYLDEGMTLTGCIPDFIAREYLAPNMRWTRWGKKDGEPEYYAGYTRANCHRRWSRYPEVDRVQRQGTLLTIVRDIRRAPAPKHTEAGKKRP
jgi:hypothetical protein